MLCSLFVVQEDHISWVSHRDYGIEALHHLTSLPIWTGLAASDFYVAYLLLRMLADCSFIANKKKQG